MKKASLLIFALIVGPWSYGQEQEEGIYREVNLGVRMNVLDFFHAKYPSMLTGIEVFPGNRISLIGEFGPVYKPQNASFEVTRGSAMSLEARYYFESGSDGPFFGLRQFMRNVTINDRYTLGHECTDQYSNCIYYSDYSGDIRTKFTGTQVVIGAKFYLIRDRVSMEYSLAGGESLHIIDRKALNDGRLIDDSRFLSEKDFGFQPFVTVRAAIMVHF